MSIKYITYESFTRSRLYNVHRELCGIYALRRRLGQMASNHTALVLLSCTIATIYRGISGIRYLEVGTYDCSLIRMVHDLTPAAKCYGVDIPVTDEVSETYSHMPRVSRLQEDRLYNINGSAIEMDLGGSTSSLIHQAKEGTLYDIILIDGDHEYPQVAIDISMSVALLDSEGGVIVVDDFHQDNPSNPSRQIAENLSNSLGVDIYCVQKYKDSFKSVAMIPLGKYNAKYKYLLSSLDSSKII